MSNLPEHEAKHREFLYEGLLVDIVLKQDQKTMTLTRGRIKDFLTSKPFHPRGLKVRLHKEGIQRLYDTSSKSKLFDIDYQSPYQDEHFIGRVQRVYYPECFGLLVVHQQGGSIDESFYHYFQSVYKDNGILIIDDNYIYNQGFENYLTSRNNHHIDIVLYSNVKQIFIKELYSKLQRLSNIVLNVYVYQNEKLIHLNTGKEKLIKSCN